MLYYSIIGLYIAVYAVMIAHDLFRKGPEEAQAKAEEVEVDISEEARQFKPVEIIKEDPAPKVASPDTNTKVTSNNKPDPAEDQKEKQEGSQTQDDKPEKPHDANPPAATSPKSEATVAQEPWTKQAHHEDLSASESSAPKVIHVQVEAPLAPPTPMAAVDEEPKSSPSPAVQSKPNPGSATLKRLNDLKKTKYEDGILVDLLADDIEDLSERDPEMETAEVNIFRIQSHLP